MLTDLPNSEDSFDLLLKLKLPIYYFSKTWFLCDPIMPATDHSPCTEHATFNPHKCFLGIQTRSSECDINQRKGSVAYTEGRSCSIASKFVGGLLIVFNYISQLLFSDN